LWFGARGRKSAGLRYLGSIERGEGVSAAMYMVGSVVLSLLALIGTMYAVGAISPSPRVPNPKLASLRGIRLWRTSNSKSASK
jgi:hypothetical protein